MGTEWLFIATAAAAVAAIGVSVVVVAAVVCSISGENLTLIFGYLNMATTHMRSKWIDLFNELNCAKIKRVRLCVPERDSDRERSSVRSQNWLFCG